MISKSSLTGSFSAHYFLHPLKGCFIGSMNEMYNMPCGTLLPTRNFSFASDVDPNEHEVVENPLTSCPSFRWLHACPCSFRTTNPNYFVSLCSIPGNIYPYLVSPQVRSRIMTRKIFPSTLSKSNNCLSDISTFFHFWQGHVFAKRSSSVLSSQKYHIVP